MREALASLPACALSAVAMATLVACDAKAASDDRAATSFDAAAFQRPRVLLPTGELVASARPVQDAARAIAVTCRFEYAGVHGTEQLYDQCVYARKDVVALHAATAALVASGLTPETGPSASYVEEVRMFDAFITDVVPKDDRSSQIYFPYPDRGRGTLAHYQDLTAAWNAMLPQDPMPVDPVPRAVDAGAHGPLHWEVCGGSACVKTGR